MQHSRKHKVVCVFQFTNALRLGIDFDQGFSDDSQIFPLAPLFPAINRLLCGFRFLAGHTSSRQFYGFQYFDIARAAAEVSGKSFLDFIREGRGVSSRSAFAVRRIPGVQYPH
jgi:hypothetical protein